MLHADLLPLLRVPGSVTAVGSKGVGRGAGVSGCIQGLGRGV